MIRLSSCGDSCTCNAILLMMFGYCSSFIRHWVLVLNMFRLLQLSYFISSCCSYFLQTRKLHCGQSMLVLYQFIVTTSHYMLNLSTTASKLHFPSFRLFAVSRFSFNVLLVPYHKIVFEVFHFFNIYMQLFLFTLQCIG